MATPRKGIRRTRQLRQWTVEQVESGKFPGLVWDDPPAKTMFRIPWKHAGKHEFRHDEDAGFFKAWAVFKGKCNSNDPATWKTRVRCALSKSSEFEEMPERSRLDIAEPYKVYRLVPVSEQLAGCKKETSKKTKAGRSKKNSNPVESIIQPAGSLSLIKMEESSGPEAMASHTPNAMGSSAYLKVENSPELGEPAETETEKNTFCLNLVPDLPVGINATETGEDSVFLSIFYGGVQAQWMWIPANEFLITSVAAPPGAPANIISRVVLPPPNKTEDPQKQEAVRRLLRNLEKGAMVACNSKGIFIQCRDQANIFWRGPNGHGKLENGAFVELFSTKSFQAALDEFQQGLGPMPQYQVTLCVGQELDERENIDSKLIVIQVRRARS
uniref:IRF tryptophan pentad repeat domain-containing protein n=1 Tax=Anolis carolinensis TaxID=28377 RepID=H9G8A0_ANOCA